MGKTINLLPNDGYVILPISMSRVQGDQNPKNCLTYIKDLDKKIDIPSNDLIFLYTNGPYFNTEESSYMIRKRTNNQMLQHKKAIQKEIAKKRIYIPHAFHFIPFDYIILNSDKFAAFFSKLKQTLKKDKTFQQCLKEDLGKRKPKEANMNFLLEEIAVAHIIREHLVEFPKTIVKKDTFRLIVYPGQVMKSEAYVWQKKLLPQKNPKYLGRYYNATYDPKIKKIYKFDEVSLLK